MREATALTAGFFASASFAGEPVRESPAAFLERKLMRYELQALQYFLDRRSSTGLICDRVTLSGERTPAGPLDTSIASVAATGYGLAALVVGESRGVIKKQEAYELAKQTTESLLTLSERSPGGWMPHFVLSGKLTTAPNSEHSTVDTLLCVLGVIAAGEAFGGDVKKNADKIVANLDFEMVRTNGGTLPDKRTYSHGYFLEDGKVRFLRAEWGDFSEGIIVPLLALGKSNGREAVEAWDKGWDRVQRWKQGSETNFGPLPLFTYYYPLGFLDLEGKKDRQGLDPWGAAEKAVRMQIECCEKDGYPKGLFGITACDGPLFYRAYFPGHLYVEKVLAPQAQLACVPFAPDAVIEGLKLWEKLGCDDTRYGVRCAVDFKGWKPGEEFSGWKSPDAVGIDVGSTLLMIDAYRDKAVYKAMAKSDFIRRALEGAGF